MNLTQTYTFGSLKREVLSPFLRTATVTEIAEEIVQERRKGHSL